jgi:hypothetical protein
LHAQLDAMNAIAYTNESKRPPGHHVRNADTITSGGRSAKRSEKSNPGAAHAAGNQI